ncbi:putative dihydroxy-acid dehydratase protein [Eutypa lata UCREL1]|uniref:Putative dihydroxy-acid dehydratase protein n=1 Tax=Eutypa lata (strain UCR-EL1) TaxID=1287681 RepID=M7T2Q1_EUTLA|nr:putative dihydroxy-acid dehydratase protein [Eutypa lata UCREL1]
MTDFHAAGGLPELLRQLRPLLRLGARTVTGQTLGEALDGIPPFILATAGDGGRNPVIRPSSDPLHPASSLVALAGNLAPGGAVIKASASKDRRLLKHAGPAVVFKNTEDLAARIDDPDLDVTPDSVLVLQGIGPIGFPGMPEAGLIPIPRKLASQGVADMLRVSDGRMSGTAGGTVVLHVSPEAADPRSVFGIVRDGDTIRLDVEARTLHVELDDGEIEARLAESQARVQGERERAEEGLDFDFLTARGPTGS